MLVERFPVHDRATWLQLRSADITASDIGALFGAHPYRSRLAVWAAKSGLGHNRGDSPAMRRGRMLEPAVAAAVGEERPDLAITKAEVYIRAPEIRLGATPDYIAVPKNAGEAGAAGAAVLECKTALASVFERDWADGPPLAWTLQALTQAMLLDADSAIVACLVMTRDLPLHIYDIPRHPAAEAKILAAVAAMWADIETGTQPAPAAASDGGVLAAMFPRDNGEVLDLSSENHLPELLDERASLKAELSSGEHRVDEIDAVIKAKLGEAAEARLPGWRIQWRTQHRAERVTPATDYRVLRVQDLRQKEQVT